MYTVIVGGSGWISQGAESVLTHNYKMKPNSVKFYGSRARKITRENERHYQVHEWNPIRERVAVDLLSH